MISRHVSKRLLIYRSVLIQLKKMGFENVYSKTIGEEAGVTPDVVRKDLSQTEARGKRKVGYNIDQLIDMLDKFFGKNCCFEIIVVGYGNIGEALARHEDYLSERIKILASFDINPARINEQKIIPIFHTDKMEAFIEKNDVQVAVLSVSEISAQSVCDKLVRSGINGILNFTPVMLKVPEHVFVKNINFADEIMHVFYHAKVK